MSVVAAHALHLILFMILFNVAAAASLCVVRPLQFLLLLFLLGARVAAALTVIVATVPVSAVASAVQLVSALWGPGCCCSACACTLLPLMQVSEKNRGCKAEDDQEAALLQFAK
jgi:hypothetical protein